MPRRWSAKERRSARRHRGRHLGGPGRPDYVRGCVHGEVKHLKGKVTKPMARSIIGREMRRGACRVEIVNTGGFTGPATKYVKRYYGDKVKLLRK